MTLQLEQSIAVEILICTHFILSGEFARLPKYYPTGTKTFPHIISNIAYKNIQSIVSGKFEITIHLWIFERKN